MESSRHVYLRALKAARAKLVSLLPDLCVVVGTGESTVADPNAVWFEVQFTRPRTVAEVRELLARRDLSDHVVRVDLLRQRGFGSSQAQQVELFQEGPRVSPVVTPDPPAVRRGRSSKQMRLL